MDLLDNMLNDWGKLGAHFAVTLPLGKNQELNFLPTELCFLEGWHRWSENCSSLFQCIYSQLFWSTKGAGTSRVYSWPPIKVFSSGTIVKNHCFCGRYNCWDILFLHLADILPNLSLPRILSWFFFFTSIEVVLQAFYFNLLIWWMMFKDFFVILNFPWVP